MKKRLIYSLVLFYFFSSYLSAAHIHRHLSASHDNCKVCIVVKNLHIGDAPQLSIVPDAFTLIVPEPYYPLTVVSFISAKGFDSHAPPFFS